MTIQLTGTTITDEQITELRRSPRTHGVGSAVEGEVMELCRLALADTMQPGDEKAIWSARARCAAIINRRCPKCGSLCDHSAWAGRDCPWCPK